MTRSKVEDLTGDASAPYDLRYADLGAPRTTPDGRTLYVFGDSFSTIDGGRLSGNWRSPTGLYSTTTSPSAGIAWSGAVGGSTAQQLWPYDHGDQYSTIIPSDLLRIGDSLYLHATAMNPYPEAIWSGIWQSDDNGATWTDTGARFDPNQDGGSFQQWTWEYDQASDYVYVFSDNHHRDRGIILHRVRPDQITDPASYQPWGSPSGTPDGWAWGNTPTPVIGGHCGEMSIRLIDGKWLFTFLDIAATNEDGSTGNISGFVLDSPTSDIVDATRYPLIVPPGALTEATGGVANHYAGYIIPGSTIDDLNIVVSQWVGGTSNVQQYRSMQYHVQGFGS